MKKNYFIFHFAIDLILLFLAFYMSLAFRWQVVSLEVTKETAVFGVLSVTILSVCFYYLGIFQRLWRYSGINDFVRIILATTVGIVLIQFTVLIFLPTVYLSSPPLLWLTTLLLLGGVRFARRLMWEHTGKADPVKNRQKTLIVGAGGAGALIARTLQSSKTKIALVPIGYIDDDINKKGLRLCGLPILGTRNDIPEISRKLGVYEAIIAVPSATPEEIKSIALICHQSGVKVKVLPSVLDLIQGENLLEQIQELHMEDLLHRNEVAVNLAPVKKYLAGQRVMVTGAGGSIGSELCRQICALNPQELILLGHGENSIHEIFLELKQNWPDVNCIPVIADIKDHDKLSALFAQYKPKVVFHAAAHKHVNLMERHPDEAFKNNVFGTLNLARMADRYNTEIFVLISTDKAVNPTSIMGLTKMLAEMIIRHYAENSKTKFVSVRFGNVLGSRGSVVHLFRKQIANGGPVTVTHPEMRRFFMTIREAVQLVMEAGALATGGELFVLDMGEPVKIVDLAQDMILLSGSPLSKNIEIKYIGLFPGEKMDEELLTKREQKEAIQHNKIFIIKKGSISDPLINLILAVKGCPSKEELNLLMDYAINKYKWNNL